MLADLLAGRHLVVLLARLRRLGRARPLRPDRAQGADLGRRLPLCRQAHRHPRAAGRDRGGPAGPRARRDRALPRSGCRSGPGAGRRDAGGLRAAQPRHAHLRPASLRPPALRALLLGHDRQAQGHRPRPGRHAAPAPQGAPPAHRHPAGRAALLLHDLRLDDVELAGLGAGLRGDARALRRLALPSRPRDALEDGRGGAGRRLRHQRQIYRQHQEGGPGAARRPRSGRAQGRALHRLAAAAGIVRLRLRRHQGGPAAGLDLGRHRHRLLLRAGQPRGAGVAGRDPDARPRPRGRGDGRYRPAGARPEGRAGLPEAFPLHAGAILERPGRRALPQELLRPLPERLVPWRLCRDHGP